jgi:hypothetical protein
LTLRTLDRLWQGRCAALAINLLHAKETSLLLHLMRLFYWRSPLRGLVVILWILMTAVHRLLLLLLLLLLGLS